MSNIDFCWASYRNYSLLFIVIG